MADIPVPTITVDEPPEEHDRVPCSSSMFSAPSHPESFSDFLGSSSMVSATEEQHNGPASFGATLGISNFHAYRGGGGGDDMRLSGASSPIDSPLSPLSSASGDCFPDNFSEYWSDSMSHTSSRSQSPLLQGLSLQDSNSSSTSFSPPEFQEGSSTSRHRSSSFHGRGFSDESSSDSRPRSSSVSALSRPDPSVEDAFPPPSPDLFVGGFMLPPAGPPEISLEQDYSVTDYSGTFSSGNTHGRSVSWGGPGSGGNPGLPSLQTDFLTVPNLQRRNAHRRTVSHLEGMGRGRSMESSPVGSQTPGQGFLQPQGDIFFPPPQDHAPGSSPFQYMDASLDNAFGVDAMSLSIDHFSDGYSSDSSFSGHVSPASPQYSPTAPPSDSVYTTSLLAPQTSSFPHSPHSPLSATPSSSSTEAEMSEFSFNVIPPDAEDAGISRRNTYTSSPSSSNLTLDALEAAELQRAASDPSGRSSSRGAGRRRKNIAGTSVFKSDVKQDPYEAGSAASSSTMLSDIRGPSPSRSSGPDHPYKKTVASKKICQASKKRRKNANAEGAYRCDQCNQDFTTRHNLNYHLNSHSGTRNYKCEWCGMSSVHPHVIKRHKDNSCKLRPQLKKDEQE